MGGRRRKTLRKSARTNKVTANEQAVPEEDENVDIQTCSPPSKTAEAIAAFDEITFGGRLTDAEADRTPYTPGLKDVRLFKQSLAAATAASSVLPKKYPPSIDHLYFGMHHLRPWYAAPFPEEYFEGPTPGHLWMCERCLKYSRTRATHLRHLPKCSERLPPGCEIYRKDNLSVFEVNGRFSRDYCQRLCLLAKMFLDHKTLYYDVETFLFYILIEWSPTEPAPNRCELAGYSFIGYFSKEKQSPSDYNLSCIMTLPQHQRRGFGAFLMDLSYLLSRRECKRGSPEKPLSDLGLVGYVRYWSRVVAEVLLENGHKSISVETICERTGMIINDVLATLEHLKAISWDGKRYVLVMKKKELLVIPPIQLKADPACLHWVPYTCLR